MGEFLAIFVISYVLHACGITIGYHRLLSHRAFCAPKAVEYFWVALGFLAFEGSPIWWATIHRAHHRHVDTPLDPHSPRYGLGNAFTGWLMLDEYPSHICPETQSRDITRDPIYRFLEQGGNLKRGHALSFAINFAVRGIIWAVFGPIPALASLCGGLAVLGIPLMLNVVCHMKWAGYKNFKGSDDSVNVWWVGLLAMGEGWHNNHHAYPGSARSGLNWWELDISWLIIKFMSKFKLVYQINDAMYQKVQAAKRQKRTSAPATVPTLPSMPALSGSIPQIDLSKTRLPLEPEKVKVSV